MIREVDLVSYLPPTLQEYKEQKNTLTAENPEFTIVWNAADRVLYNEFISTADEYGIARYEKILGILPFAEDTLESRRVRVQSRWFTAIPYTIKSLVVKLVTLCGDSGFSLEKKFEIYHLEIRTNLELYRQVEELEKLLGAVIPCNIVILSNNDIPCSVTCKLYPVAVISSTESYIISQEDN